MSKVVRRILVTACGLAGCSVLFTCGNSVAPTDSTEPVPVFRAGTDAMLWSDNFDSYVSVAAMSAGGASGTVPNFGDAGNQLMSPGRGGSGKALRSDYSVTNVFDGGPGQQQRSVNW